jgi:hypothetical protein
MRATRVSLWTLSSRVRIMLIRRKERCTNSGARALASEFRAPACSHSLRQSNDKLRF